MFGFRQTKVHNEKNGQHFRTILPLIIVERQRITIVNNTQRSVVIETVHDFQYAGTSNTSTGMISIRPIHIMITITARVVVGKPA